MAGTLRGLDACSSGCCWRTACLCTRREACASHTWYRMLQGAMTQQPNVFSSHYYKELLAGGGAFPSDKSLLSDPATAQWVRCERHCVLCYGCNRRWC